MEKNVYKRCERNRNIMFTSVADVKKIRKGYKLLGSLSLQKEFQSEVDTEVAPWMKRNWGTLQLNAQVIDEIYEQMQLDNIMLASDGSVLDNGNAAHAYCIAKHDTNEIIFKAAAPVDGDRERMTSYRAEAFGALAAISFIEHIRKIRLYNEALHIPIYIDNMEVIRTLNGEKNVYSIGMGLEDNTDIAIELYQTAHNSKIDYEAVHVKSHMDDETSELTSEQELNCEMDHMVGNFIRNPPPRLEPHEIPPILPQQKVCIVHLENPLVMDIRDTIILSMMQNEVIDFFKKRHKIQHDYIHEIDLETMEKVLNSSKNTLGKKVKNINQEWHTMSISKKWKRSPSDICPLCQRNKETWKHVYSCPCIDMQRCKRDNVQKIQTQLQRLKTLPQITEHFIAVLSGNVEDIPQPENYQTSSYTEQIIDAHKIQKKIGYEAFFKGFLTKKWYKLQAHYYRKERIDRKYNSRRWRKEVIRMIIHFGNELWNERCSIVNLENSSTDEQLYRQRMYTFSIQVKQLKDRLNPKDHHLLQRNRKYFFKSDRVNIEMWQTRLVAAFSCEENKRKNQKDSIEPFLTRKQRNRKKRKAQYLPDPKKYRQTVLFNSAFNIQRKVQSQSSATPPLLQPEITQEKRRRLEKLVHKKKRKRQSTLVLPAFTTIKTKKRTRIMTKKRSSADIHPTNTANKRSRIEFRVGSVRENARKVTGQDTKNNR